MPPYNYQDKIAELVAHGHIASRLDAFTYDEAPLAQHYEQLFQFCQENLDTMNLQYPIRPGCFYFKANIAIGAQAKKINGYSSISMNVGAVYSMHEFFREHFDVDGPIPEGELLSLEETPLQYVMYQTVVLFLYYHELAHLIQMSDEETYINNPAQGYSREQHLREMDADLFAAQYICNHILLYLREHPAPSSQVLEDYTTVAITSLFSLFFKGQGGPLPVYFEEHKHPHPMIRITYIQDYISRRIAEQKPVDIAFDGLAVLRKFMVTFQPRVSAVFNGNGLVNYAQAIVDNQGRIEDFVTGMFRDRVNLPELVINRQRARQEG